MSGTAFHISRSFSDNSYRVVILAAFIFAALTSVLPAWASSDLEVEVVALFDPILRETPESVVIDLSGDRYVVLAQTGEIRKISRTGEQSTLAVLPIGVPFIPCQSGGGFTGLVGAMAQGPFGNLYVNVAACDSINRGIWRVGLDGSAELIVPLPMGSLPNGLAQVGPWLFVADSFGKVWRAPIWGGEAVVWSEHPLLREDPTVFAPGPNGIQYFRGELFIANSDTAQIVAFPLNWNGSPGEPRVHAQLPFGCDDFAFDVRGSIFCTTDPFNVILEISPDGMDVEVILDGDDLLDGPTAAAFGRRGLDRFELYITNAAFPIFTVANRPSLLRVRLDYPGARR